MTVAKRAKLGDSRAEAGEDIINRLPSELLLKVGPLKEEIRSAQA